VSDPNGAAPRPFRLEVRDLEIRSGNHGAAVVSGVCFAVRPGDVLGLVGESGSGKTTVALALLGHTRRGLSVSCGEILLDGLDLLRLRPPGLRQLRGARVSYVPQDPSAALNPALRIGYQLREALQVHGHPGPASHPRRSRLAGDPGKRILEVLSEVRLEASPAMLRRYPHQLSGGQQQRVALAMAFACRPSLIVLDEPTTGLDVSTQRHILDTIRSLCRGYGVAAVYVSHDLAVVSELADDVAVMYAGRVVEAGPAALLLHRPLHPYTRGLLASVPGPDRGGPLAGIPGQQPPPGHRGPGCAFAPRCGLALDPCRARVPEPAAVAGRTVRCLRAAEADSVAGAARSVPRPVAPAAGPPPVPALLSVRGLSFNYGPVPVLSGIDLDVPPRACVAVVGESGSGKTTLARCIVGLHRNWTGEMTLQGVPLAPSARHRPGPVLQQIQCVFQNPYTSLNPRKTVGQIVAEPLRRFLGVPRGEQADRVVSVLEDVSLGGHYLSRYPDQLSGGERQRVAIARALVAEPGLLVCDEVTSALDVSVQAVVVELLRAAAARRHLAMVFITHNLALVRNVAQFAVVLRQGEIVEAGPADQVLADPRSRYTAQLMADVPRLRS
jgi:peptide/nickel transport system ATP-binding protein